MTNGMQRGTVTGTRGIWTIVKTGHGDTLVPVGKSRGARVGQRVTILWSLTGWYVRAVN